MEVFKYFTDNLDIQREDVLVQMFTHTLEREVRRWFRELGDSSLIEDMLSFQEVFFNQ